VPHDIKRIALALLISALAACSRTNATAGATGRETLRIALAQDVKSLNPLLASTTQEGFVTRFMFEPLVSADANGKPVPILASSVPSLANGGISRDGSPSPTACARTHAGPTAFRSRRKTSGSRGKRS